MAGKTGWMTDITLPAPVQRVVDSINSADAEAFVAAFTDDGIVNDWGRVLGGPDGYTRPGERSS